MKKKVTIILSSTANSTKIKIEAEKQTNTEQNGNILQKQLTVDYLNQETGFWLKNILKIKVKK